MAVIVFVDDFDCLIHIINVRFKFLASQLTKNWFYICFKCFENGNCFKISPNLMFYKLTLLPLPVRGMTTYIHRVSLIDWNDSFT